ncbi:MAG: hypothetical protein NWE96_01640 [Candidatus Bathyarchaeota archaeon]|nr:hypothetical protein [Candidatus Bathyarchaeota archaeon]
MAACPNCGEEVEKPSKVLKNRFFSVERYNCEKCHFMFKKTS